MNDYTKNLSSSCWSPGLYADQNKLNKFNKKYDKKRSSVVQSKFENTKYLETNVEGYPGIV